MLESLGRRGSATGCHRFRVVRQSAETVRPKITDVRFRYASTVIVRRCGIDCIVECWDCVEVGLQHSPPSREFRSCCMMRWIFRLIVMTVVAKLVNRYLGSRYPQPRPRDRK